MQLGNWNTVTYLFGAQYKMKIQNLHICDVNTSAGGYLYYLNRREVSKLLSQT